MKNKRLLIIGAGEAAQLLIEDIKENKFLDYDIIGFVDDYKIGKIDEIPILGKIKEIQEISNSNKIEELIIAIPSLRGDKLREVIDLCKKTNLETKILPGTYESAYSLKTGRPWYKPIRQINMEDLLSRKPILIDLREMEDYVSGKEILITGGGGSIGSELCKQLAELNPKKLIILDNCEYNLYEIDQEIKDKYENKIEIISIIGDVKDKGTMKKIFKENKVDSVFHAAAYKHVPLMESNIREAVKNNIFGTYNVASLSSEYNVKNFVLISTDKAVNPTSIMGATKRIAEMVIQLFNGDTKFVTVRFGNVLGSRGSVIPLFEKQINKGGPITITHPEITRYFMTIPEAVQLVIQAGTIGKNKEVLILDMGQPYKVIDIARELIKLHGLEPEVDIKIEFVGLRPGEKLYEELLTAQEGVIKTKNNRIFISKTQDIDKEKLESLLLELKSHLEDSEDGEIIKKISEIVPSYIPTRNDEFSKLKKLKILITGDKGFIGTNLKKRLKEIGCSWYEASLKEGIDLSDPSIIEKLPPADLVFHLASSIPQKSTGEYEKDIECMKNILNFCEKNNSRLIFTSSSAVYGKTDSNPVKEDSVLNPVNDYGKSKVACEELFQKSNVGGNILRIFNIYGPRQYEKFVIPSLIKGIKENEVKITLGAKRDFIYISDVVDGILKAAIFCGKDKEIFNLGSGNSSNLEEIAKLIANFLNKEIKITYLENLNMEIKDIYADIEKAKNLLNWKPKISISEGIKNNLEEEKL